mmetsp:Transcript_2536/g.3505  ORF Transcript_2536/g.3505 Transcript_2536/m.3505 type:complete len:99 (-) Transcript_2536:158-454(-)
MMITRSGTHLSIAAHGGLVLSFWIGIIARNLSPCCTVRQRCHHIRVPIPLFIQCLHPNPKTVDPKIIFVPVIMRMMTSKESSAKIMLPPPQSDFPPFL